MITYCLVAQVSVTMEILRYAQNDTVTNQNGTVGTSIIRLKRCRQHESVRMGNERRRQIQMEELISSHLPPLVSDLCPDPLGRWYWRSSLLVPVLLSYPG